MADGNDTLSGGTDWFVISAGDQPTDQNPPTETVSTR